MVTHRSEFAFTTTYYPVAEVFLGTLTWDDLSALPGDTPLSKPWYDDFGRADGAVGPKWIQGKGTATGTDGPVPLVIEGGAAVASLINTPTSTHQSAMLWAEPQGPDQSIEVDVADVWVGDGYLQLYVQADGATFAATMVEASFIAGTSPVVRLTAYAFATTGEWPTPPPTVDWPHAATEPVRIRFEVSARGDYRVSVDGTLALSWHWDDPVPGSTIPRPSGSYVGMALNPSLP